MLIRLERSKLDQKVEVARFRSKSAIGRRAEHLQPPYAMPMAQRFMAGGFTDRASAC